MCTVYIRYSHTCEEIFREANISYWIKQALHSNAVQCSVEPSHRTMHVPAAMRRQPHSDQLETGSAGLETCSWRASAIKLHSFAGQTEDLFGVTDVAAFYVITLFHEVNL